jgi:hypothetical protein
VREKRRLRGGLGRGDERGDVMVSRARKEGEGITVETVEREGDRADTRENSPSLSLPIGKRH